MKKYPVYQTKKGNLTFVEKPWPAIYVISAHTKQVADEMLAYLKKQMKNIEKQDE